METLSLHSTSVSGDISGWTMPTNVLGNVSIYGTALDYDATNGFFSAGVKSGIDIRFENCSLTSNQVSNVLLDLDASGTTSGEIVIGGNNEAPTAAGITAAGNLLGKGWTPVSYTAP
jgi:hypothetical protein